ncbi:MAG: histidine kinase [Bacillota bacterium]|nr:histidine kinase [Bacillota bacterium]
MTRETAAFIPGRILWPAILLPAAMAGGFEFLRHGLPLFERMPTPLGNLATGALALLGSLVYFRVVLRLMARWIRRAEAERAARLALEQREAVAAELHDRVLQALFFLGVELRHLRQRAPEELSGAMDDVLAALGEVDAEVRRALRRLRASEEEAADEAGDDLSRVMEEVLLGSGILLRCEPPLPAPLPLRAAERRRLAAIVREALVNVRKHARAQTVRVGWNEEVPGRFLLTIADDGVGFDPERVPRGFGLALMRRRAAEAGWELALESAPGRGTELRLRGGPLAVREPRVEAAGGA